MADGIKVININRNSNNDENEVKKFEPIEKPWYDDETQGLAMEFDENENAIINDEKGTMSILNNSNANYITPRRKQQQVPSNMMHNEVPDSIKIVPHDGESKLPDEIIRMRQNDYLKNEQDKEALLQKLNININKDKKQSNFAQAKPTERIQESPSVETNDANLPKTLKKVLGKDQFKDSVIKQNNADDILKKLNIDPDKLNDVGKTVKKVEEKDVTPDFKPKENIASISPFGNSAVSNEVTSILRPYVEPTKEEIKQTVFQQMEEILQEEPRNYVKNQKLANMPVLNDLNYTIANTVDDFDKVIYHGHSRQKIDESIFGKYSQETTVLINSLVNEAENLQKLRREFKESDFEDFESWFKTSKDIKKLKKLAAKEHKRMLKENKKVK